MNALELSEQEIGRRQSLKELREMGINPYPAAEYPTNAFSTDIKKEFSEKEEQREVCIAGRIMSVRVMGKASFAELQDSKGRIQIYITRADAPPAIICSVGVSTSVYPLSSSMCLIVRSTVALCRNVSLTPSFTMRSTYRCL